MPKRTDIHKVLVIGSGPIVIGQAAEFDYAGTQACLALKEEGYEVVLANSNPATIMTDNAVADKVYMEPLTLEYIARICRYERPDALVPGIGGQTGLNLAMQLYDKSAVPRTVNSSRSCVSASANRWFPRRSPTAWKRDLPQQRGSGIRSSCAPHLLWEEPAAVSPMTKRK